MNLAGFTAHKICDLKKNRAILWKLSDGRQIWIPRQIIKTCDPISEDGLYARYFIEVERWFTDSERISCTYRTLKA